MMKGGNRIHSLRGSDVYQHGIVKDQAGIIANLGDHKDDQEQEPGAGKR